MHLGVPGGSGEGAKLPLLTVSKAAILHFDFWLGPGISHELTLAVLHGADFWCVLNHF